MRTWLNYTTFIRDKDWLDLSLRSFRKYCTGFSGVTIVVPTWDVDKFLQFERYSTPDCPVLIKNFLEHPSKGFVHHLAMKCYADVFSPQADLVLHLDPDCLFCAPTTPSDYLVEGKPVLVIEPYEHLKTAHPGRYGWKKVTEEALKFECKWETMCRHPAAHLKNTYQGTRARVEEVHQTPFIDYFIKQKNSYPQGACEFTTLGAWALKYTPNDYWWIDRCDQGDKNDPPKHVEQFWSYKSTGVYANEIKRILS